MSCCSALALYVCLRSAGAAMAIDAVMKVASTSMQISRLDWKQPCLWEYNWGWSRKHGLERLVCMQLVLSAQPQKPHFYTLVGWTGSNAHLEAYLKAAPLLEIQLGLVKETWSRKTSLCATSSVRPAPKAPLFHNSGLTMFDSYFEA